MHKHLLTGILILLASIGITTAQTVDLSSVDAFFKVTETLIEGKEVSAEQWGDFGNSRGYRAFAERENKTLINIIQSSVNLAFGQRPEAG